MAFCKICACGEKVVFARRMSFPEVCPSCSRRLEPFQTYREDDPAGEELLARAREAQDGERPGTGEEESGRPAPGPGAVSGPGRYSLLMADGSRIAIPEEGGVVGRTGLGGDYLADFPSVSRQHLRVIPRRGGVILEDISSYGTFLNGQRLEQGVPVRAEPGARITLCNVDCMLSYGEE